MKTTPKMIAAGHLADRIAGADYERRQFMIAPDLRSVSFVTTDGEEAVLYSNADGALATGRHELLNHLLHCVHKHLHEERKMLRRMARRL